MDLAPTDGACQHDWRSSPTSPIQYCSRCGAIRGTDGQPPKTVVARPLTAGAVPGAMGRSYLGDDAVDPTAAEEARRAIDDLDGRTTPVPPTAVDARSAVAVSAAVDQPIVRQRTTASRTVSPAVLAGPEPIESRSSPSRSWVLIAALLISGAVLGFFTADATWSARQRLGQLGAAATPASAIVSGPPRTPPAGFFATEVPSAVATAGSGAVATPLPSTAPAVSLTPVPPPILGPAMAPPVAALGGALAPGGIAVRLGWQPPADGTEVARYDLAMARDGGAPVAVRLPKRTARSVTVPAAAGHDYTFDVRARAAGGPPGDAATTSVALGRMEESDPNIRLSRGWKIARHPAYTGSGAAYATDAGAQLTLAFEGTGIAIVGPVGPGRGRAVLTVDGERAGSFDAGANKFKPVNLLAVVDGLADGPHILTLRVSGTGGRPMVAVDRFLVLDPY